MHSAKQNEELFRTDPQAAFFQFFNDCLQHIQRKRPSKPTLGFATGQLFEPCHALQLDHVSIDDQSIDTVVIFHVHLLDEEGRRCHLVAHYGFMYSEIHFNCSTKRRWEAKSFDMNRGKVRADFGPESIKNGARLILEAFDVEMSGR